MRKNKLIIFDLDGVLINSINNMKYSLNKTSRELKIELKFEIYKKYLGLPFEDIMKKMKISDNIKNIKKRYEFFSEQNLSKVKIKKSFVGELIKLKKNFYLSVFTSKNRKRTLQILKKYKLFDYIVTSDDIKKGKPNPEGLKKILSKFKISRNNCLFIGDSIYDYYASNSAKIRYAHAMWGYEKKLKKKNILKLTRFNEISNIL